MKLEKEDVIKHLIGSSPSQPSPPTKKNRKTNPKQKPFFSSFHEKRPIYIPRAHHTTLHKRQPNSETKHLT